MAKWNLREYILHRDNHQCQNPGCKSKTPELEVHHIGYWKDDRTDRPGNLITLCIKCHRPENHKEGGLLWGWEPKVNSFKAETFMNTVRWKMVNILGSDHTYGHITKIMRHKEVLVVNSMLDELYDISAELEKSIAKLNKFIDGIYEYEKTEKGYRCQLKDRGICLHLMGETPDCYDNYDDCYIKKSGLYYCGEIDEVVDQESCDACNQDMDCGCCEYVQNGSAPFNCNVCGKLQIEIENIGHYCVAPDTSPEEIERIKKEAKEDPGRFFSCY